MSHDQWCESTGGCHCATRAYDLDPLDARDLDVTAVRDRLPPPSPSPSLTWGYA